MPIRNDSTASTPQHLLNWSGSRRRLCWAEVLPTSSGVLRWSTRATSCLRDVSSWRLSHETKRTIIDENKQSVFGSADIVTAGYCLFVFSRPLPVGVNGRTTGGATYQQDMLVDVIARHGEWREDAHPNEQSGRSCQPVFHIAPPHNMSVARHGCAHMR
jgi:hypothetical protein